MSEVYFISAPDLGLVKIGVAKNARHRFSKVQSDSPSRLVLLAVEAGDMSRERELHHLFAEYRHRGEWFRNEGALADYIATLPAQEFTRRRKILGGALGRWMHENGHDVRSAAQFLGLNISTVSRICAGKHIPRRDAMLRIYERTGGEVTPNDFFGIAA